MNPSQQSPTRPLRVLKFGGATLADSSSLKAAALRISILAKSHRLIVAVSAMGQTTNNLIAMAMEVSPQPLRREMDMLLSVGERISMSLLSMALNDLGCAAISFTGSQAGIMTNDSHVNALIIDLKPFRVEQALSEGKVVIIAGFQGVSPTTKEITTLGRGGTDTTAVAMAAHFRAERCDILKDVAGIFTADPKLVPEARPLNRLSYEALLEMTFWGAKVLHYRSVELAKKKEVLLYIGPASGSLADGTIVQKGSSMTQATDAYESSQVLSINSFETVLRAFASPETPAPNSKSVAHHKNRCIADCLETLQEACEKYQISFPQILAAEWASELDSKLDSDASPNRGSVFFLTGPAETMQALKGAIKNNPYLSLDAESFSTVTLTCSGVTSPALVKNIMAILKENQVEPLRLFMSAMSVNLVLHPKDRIKAIGLLHPLTLL